MTSASAQDAEIAAAGPDAGYYRVADVRDGEPQPELAGSRINGRESDEAIAIVIDPERERISAAVPMLAGVLGIEPRDDGAGGFVLETPIGIARLPRGELERIRGVDYALLPVLAERLGVGLSFDPADFLVEVTAHWLLETEPGVIAAPEPVDIVAPKATLSRLRSQLDYRRQGGEDSFASQTELGGALGPGVWQLRYFDDLDDNRRLQDYTWILARGPSRYLVGNQRLLLSNSLPGFELTGAQYAWSNRPDAAYTDYLGYGQIVASRYTPVRNLRGEGPPGGIAELRIDGGIVARQVVRLDGYYEFRDVTLPSPAARVEVLVYDRTATAAPIRTDTYTGQASDRLLPAGAIIHYAGAGLYGNPLSNTDELDGSAGFYHYRHGISDRVSIEAIAQNADSQTYGAIAATAGFGPFGTYSAELARGADGDAYYVAGDGRRGRWFWRLQQLEQSSGYLDGESPRRAERFGEVGLDVTPRLTIAAVSRYRVEGDQRDDVFGPALRWRPIDSVFISADPDYAGYLWNASWYIGARSRLAASHSPGRTVVEAERLLGSEYRLLATTLDDDALGRRHGLVLSRVPFSSRAIAFSVGVLTSEGETGYLADASLELRPGLTARAQIVDDPLGGNERRDPLFQLTLVADYVVTGSGLSASTVAYDDRDVGSIAGAIISTATGKPIGVENVGVSVDGQVLAHSDANGRYVARGLKPGVHTVALDPEALPIELRPIDKPLAAEVRRGAATRVDLKVAVRVGFAGRVTAAEGELGTVAIEVKAPDGTVIAQARPNRWGLYRIDDLDPGVYTVVATAPDGSRRAERTVELSDRFRFGQDLDLGTR